MSLDKLRYGTSDLIILSIISRTPTYGYDLLDILSHHSSLNFSQAIVYPTLSRLYKSGLLSRTRKGNRLYYSITPKGQRYLTSEITRWHTLSRTINHILGE